MNKTISQLVMLHGWGVNEKLLRQFSQQYLPSENVYCPAMPAYGTHISSDGSMNSICTNLYENLEQLEPFVLLGWSLGGMIAVRYAAMFPQTVQRLILVCVNPSFVKKPDWGFGVEPAELRKMIKGLGLDLKEVLKRFYLLALHGDKHTKKQVKAIFDSGYDAGLSQNGLAFGLQLLAEQNVFNDMEQLDCPIAIAYSEHDALIPVETFQAERFQQPNISLYKLPAATHIPFLSCPKTVAHLVKRLTG